MTISANETSLTLTGVESPIVTLDISGQLIDFTAYDGTLASVTAGTPYTLTLSGFSSQDEAFNGESPPETIGFFLNVGTNLFVIDGLRQRYTKTLPVDGQDSYTLTLDKDWIYTESIEAFSASCDGATITPLTVNDNVLQFTIYGASPGLHEITFDYSTPTRSRQYKAGIRVT